MAIEEINPQSPDVYGGEDPLSTMVNLMEITNEIRTREDKHRRQQEGEKFQILMSQLSCLTQFKEQLSGSYNPLDSYLDHASS